jgi:hypothetical protein
MFLIEICECFLKVLFTWISAKCSFLTVNLVKATICLDVGPVRQATFFFEVLSSYDS